MNVEIVLPSGKFAAIRRVTWRDWLVVRAALVVQPDSDPMALFAARCVTIDSLYVTVQDIMGMDVQDAFVLANALQRRISGPVRQDS